MVKVQNVCLNCYEAITNPTCERCYAKEIELWIKDIFPEKEVAKKIIRKLKSSFPIDSFGEPACILCKKEMTNICMYCYFFKVERLLKSLNLPEEVLESFLQTFNYKLYDSIWVNDFENSNSSYQRDETQYKNSDGLSENLFRTIINSSF